MEDPRVTKLKHMKEGMATVFKFYASPETGLLDFNKFKKLMKDAGIHEVILPVIDLNIIYIQAKGSKDQALD